MALEERASDAVSVGAAVRLMRERSGLSARALSSAAGLSPAYVNKVESGQLEPSFRAFARIARQLGMSQREVYVLVMAESEKW